MTRATNTGMRHTQDAAIKQAKQLFFMYPNTIEAYLQLAHSVPCWEQGSETNANITAFYQVNPSAIGVSA